MRGDETESFPDGRCLRREGSHLMMVFGWPEQFLVAENGEFRHTDLGNRYFGVISGKPG